MYIEVYKNYTYIFWTLKIEIILFIFSHDLSVLKIILIRTIFKADKHNRAQGSKDVLWKKI